ncbi:MAG: 3-dehydroquinate dehydratase, partial [Chloroflexi bacterium]|nr:3-dehydroquinate dehydratase [Chloroflexota bacterium]
SRDPSKYGTDTLKDVEGRIEEKARDLEVEVAFFQSNHEGAIVDRLQTASSEFSGVVINAGALTHYGLSMRDALVDSRLPIVEVHMSNIHAREEFRHKSVIADIAVGQIAGLGWRGYLFGLEFLTERLKENGAA